MIENQLSHSNNGSVTTLNRCGSRSGHRSVSGSLNSSIRTIPSVVNNPNGGHHPHKQVRPTSKKEVKKAKTLFIIVLVFMVCWVPLYTVNCVQAFCKTCTLPQIVTDCFIVLSHANSAINPFLYAYHMREFRDALKKHIFKVKPKVRGRGFELNSLSGHLVKVNGNVNTSSSQPQTGTSGSSKPKERVPRLSGVPELAEAVSTSGDLRKNSEVAFPVMEDPYFDCDQLQYELVNKAFVRDDLDEGFESTTQNSPIGDLEADLPTSRPTANHNLYGENYYGDKVTKKYLHSVSLDAADSTRDVSANQDALISNRDVDWLTSKPINDEQLKCHRRYMHSVSLDANSLVARPIGRLPALKVANKIVHSLSLDSHLSGIGPMISKLPNHAESSTTVEPIANSRNNVVLGKSPKHNLLLSVDELWKNLPTNQNESANDLDDDSLILPTVQISTNQVFSSNYVTNEESQRNDISV